MDAGTRRLLPGLQFMVNQFPFCRLEVFLLPALPQPDSSDL